MNRRVPFASLAALMFASCRPPERPGYDAFVPAEPVARAALHASLDAWRAGRPAGPANSGEIPVEVSDSYRSPGRPLLDFEILGPVGGGDRRCYAVRLDFGDEAVDEPPVVRYLVVGRDPLWVFRLEDYERISHWEHKMDDGEAAPDGTPPDPSETPAHPAAGPHSP